MANEEFADKVISALQKSQKAVDLSAQDVPVDVPVEVPVDVPVDVPVVKAQGDIIAFGGVAAPEPDGPITGGFKDILILPNYGGTAATTPSQINFYWKSPTIPDQTGFDTNVRATIYNFAQTTGLGVTIPVLVFGGYDGTTNYLPSRNWGASGTGVTAKIFLDPFRGDITLDYLELNIGVGASTKQGNLWYDSTGDKVRFAISTSTTSGFAKTLAFTDDIPGSVNMFYNWTDSLSNTSIPDAAQDTFTLASGLGMTVFINSASDTATFAVAGRLLNDVSNQTLNLLASPSVSPAGMGISGLQFLTYTPNTYTLDLTSSGVINARFISANLSGTAVTANFITANTQFNGTLVGFHNGNASGTAATYTNFYGALTGNVTGLASTASAVTIGSVATGTYYPTFVNVNTAAIGLTLVTDANISFDANTNTLTTSIFSGFLSGNVSGSAVTANFFTANTQITGFLSGNVSGTAVTANFITANTQFSGTLVGFLNGNASGTAATYTNFYGNFVGTANTASAVTIGAVASGTYYPTFVNTNAAAIGLTLVTDANINFNSATNTLTTDIFSGFLTGNVSGTALTATFLNGFLQGNVSGTALTANFVTANTQFNGFLSGNVSGTAVTANFITANTQFSGTLVGFHNGNASGTAATYTAFYGPLVGIANTASAVTIGAVVAGTYYPTFVNVNTAAIGLTLVTDANISFDANTNTLTTSIFSGFLTGNVSGSAVTATFLNGFLQGNVSGTALTANFITANTQFTGFLSGNVSGTAVTANFITANTQFSGTLVGFHSGNASGTAATYTNFFGTLAGTASTAQNLNTVATGTNPNQQFLLMSNTNGGSGVAVSSAGAGLTFAPNTNRLYAGSFQANGVLVGSAANTIDLIAAGSLTLGSASNAVIIPGNLTVQGTTITVDSTISTLQDPITVLGAAVGGTHLMSDDGKDRGVEFRWSTGAGNATTGFFGFDRSTGRFTYIPNGTNVSEVFSGSYGIFEGNLTGNAVTASIIQATTGFFGNFSGTVSGYASTSQSITVSQQTTGTLYPTFVNTNAGSAVGLSVFTDTDINFNSSTNVLTVPVVSGFLSGNVSGTAVTATNFYGALTGNVTGLASTASAVTIGSVVAGTYYPTFVNVNTAGVGLTLVTDANINFNAATNNLTTDIFSGFLSGNVSGSAVTANFFTANTQITGFLSGNVSGTAVTANFITANTQFSGTLVGFHNGNASGTAATYTNFYGNFVGTANTASAVTVGAVASGTYYPTFVNTNAAAIGLTLVTDTNISFNAATNNLTTDIFSGFLLGNVSGSAVTATFLTGFLQGNVSGTALTANFVTANTQFNGFLNGNVSGSAVTANFVTANTQITGFLSGNVSGTALTANFITANTQFSGTLVGFHNGNASGTAATYTNFYGTLNGNVTGLASTASAVTVGAVASGTYYPTFVNVNTAAIGLTLVTDANISFNAATNNLTTDIFSGFLSGNVSGSAVTANFFTANTQITGFLSGNVSGTAVTANFITANTQFSGTLVGFLNGNASGTAATYTAFYGPLVGVASTASAVTVGAVVAGTYYPTFVNTNAAGLGLTLVTDTNISFDANTNNLTVPVISGFHSGNLSGNAVTATFGTFTTLNASLSGTATTAANIYVSNAASQNASHNILFSNPATSTSGLAVSSNASLIYNPSTNLLTTGLVNITSTTALSSGTYLTLTTNVSDDNSTSDFFIRALTSTAGSKFSVDANGNLRATTKSFDIEHPTKPGMRLVYGVLEGPEHGVYHRGTVEGKGIVQINLPDYWHKLIGEQYTIQLTPWGNYNVHIVEKTQDYFTIRLVGDPISRALKSIKVDYIVHGSRLDAPLKIEQDS